MSDRAGRSFEKITRSDLERLASLALSNFEEFFARDPRHPYVRRLWLICLLQTAAKHYVEPDQGNQESTEGGVNDFDVCGFFETVPKSTFVPTAEGEPRFRAIEVRSASGRRGGVPRSPGGLSLNRLPDLAAELVTLKVDVVVAGATPAARAAKQATSTIPIVAVAMGDPVADELVASLGSPGGNVTGNTFLGPELVAKRLQLFRDAVPGFSRLAAIWHPGAYGERTMRGFLKETEATARKLGIELQLVQALSAADLENAFSAMTRWNADALIVLPSAMLFAEHRRIVELAAKIRLPAMYQAREFVDAGGLMSYGANLPDLNRRAATYVDKILKGAKPANLPVEQPTTFELLVNLKTARELGLTISREFLFLADEVIE
jgi:putative ABC transport system substrate-binding protein